MNDILPRLERCLHGCSDEVELPVLFGSMARGTASRSSDVDLAVRLTERSGANHAHRIDALANAIERAVGRAVDIVDIDTAHPQLKFEIARDGRVLLESKSHAWAELRARAMLEWWDWAPLARRCHSRAVARLKVRVSDGAS